MNNLSASDTPLPNAASPGASDALASFRPELEALRAAIVAAGAAVRRLAGGKVSHKSGDDPVTEADLAADRILREALLSAFPGDGWLSEETVDSPDRLARRRVWIVDPIDGTRDFVAGIPEYAISACLCLDGAPVVAAVHNPATGELFHAVRGRGAFLDNASIRARADAGAVLDLLVSRSEHRRGEWDAFAELARLRPTGSIAYKLALIAAGRSDATFTPHPRSEWDIAAGVLILEEAGGIVRDGQGEPFVFNRPDPRLRGILAASRAAWEPLQRLAGRPGVQEPEPDPPTI